jgi:hypothetical protein
VKPEAPDHLEAEVASTGATQLENTLTIQISVPIAVWGHTKLLYVVAESEMKQRKLKTLGDQLLIRRNRVNATTTTPVFLSDFTYFAAHCLKEWYAVSVATQHMSGQRSFFRNFVPVKHNTCVVNGIGGSRLQVHGHGEILFTATVNGSTHSLSIKMVLYVPDLGTNLLSIAAVTEFGRTVHFVESLVNFNNFDKTVIVGKRIGQTLYHLAITANPSDESAYLTSPAPPSIAVWHQRFAHVSCKKISQMAAK